MERENYEDVLKEEPNIDDIKATKKWEKKLHNSVGWIDIITQGTVICKHDKNGKLIPDSDVLDSEPKYDVVLEEGGFTCDTQAEAEILSNIVQINLRLKRIEDKLNKK